LLFLSTCTDVVLTAGVVTPSFLHEENIVKKIIIYKKVNKCYQFTKRNNRIKYSAQERSYSDKISR
jgi:hypothetical protein